MTSPIYENVLVATLGATAPVISETLTALTSQGITISKVYIVHTNSPVVLDDNPKSKHRVGLTTFRDDYCPKQGLAVKCFPITARDGRALDDIHTKEDNNALMETLFRVFDQAKQEGENVYLSIAGGRKTMSALALLIGSLVGCRSINHVLVKSEKYPGSQAPEFDAVAQYGFDVPADHLRLIEVPSLNLEGLLQSILGSFSMPTTLLGYWKTQKKSVQDSLEDINRYIDQTLKQTQIRLEYDQKIDRYDQLHQAVRLILASALKEKLPKPPSLSGRVKTFDSLWKKTVRNLSVPSPDPQAGDPFEFLIDIAGVRVVTPFKSDIDTIKHIIEEEFSVVKVDEKDSPEGYWGVHFPVKLKTPRTSMPEYLDLEGLVCEIQVRTNFADTWATSEHTLRYKSTNFRQNDEEKQRKMDAIFAEVATGLRGLEERFEDVKKILQERAE